MNVPPINSKGKFTFTAPFNTLIPVDQEYEVISIRNLKELEASNENPYDTIYVSVGMTETDFVEDVNTNVPIVVFTTDGGEYFYVPGDRILSQPIKTGHSYQEKVLMVPLGNLPIDLDLTVLVNTVTETVKDTIGINSTPELVTTSSTIQYDDVEHNTFIALMNNSKTVTETYKTKYLKLLETHNKRTQIIENFELAFKNNICGA